MLKYCWVASALLAFGLAGPALAQDTKYPDHVVKIIVPYPPGGTTDVVGRIIADKLNARLGQPFIIDNRPGAAGMIGSDVAAEVDR